MHRSISVHSALHALLSFSTPTPILRLPSRPSTPFSYPRHQRCYHAHAPQNFHACLVIAQRFYHAHAHQGLHITPKKNSFTPTSIKDFITPTCHPFPTWFVTVQRFYHILAHQSLHYAYKKKLLTPTRIKGSITPTRRPSHRTSAHDSPGTKTSHLKPIFPTFANCCLARPHALASSRHRPFENWRNNLTCSNISINRD